MIMILQSILSKLSTKPRLSRKRAMTRKNAYYRHLASTTTSTAIDYLKFDSYFTLMPIIFEIFLLTILYILQYVLTFVLRRVQRIAVCSNYGNSDESMTNKNRLWRRLCCQVHRHDCSKIQSCLIDDHFDIENSDEMTS